MGNDNQFYEDTNKEIESIHRRIDKLSQDEGNFKGIKIWMDGSDEPIEVEYDKKELGYVFEQLQKAIKSKEYTVVIKNYCVVISKIS